MPHFHKKQKQQDFPGGPVVKNLPALHLDLLSILSLFLCMVLESVLVSFFYKWLTNFPGTTC